MIAVNTLRDLEHLLLQAIKPQIDQQAMIAVNILKVPKSTTTPLPLPLGLAFFTTKHLSRPLLFLVQRLLLGQSLLSVRPGCVS